MLQLVIDDVQGFGAKYARARDMGLDHEADEIKQLADQCRIGEKVTVEDGFDAGPRHPEAGDQAKSERIPGNGVRGHVSV